MKKSYLMIAAAALVLTSCTDSMIRNDVNNGGEEVQRFEKIGFATFAAKATRAQDKPASSDYYLEDYHTTMAVYGTKKDAEGTVQRVFDEVTCTYNAANDNASGDGTGEWQYSPARYWDKESSYKFAAFAPATANMAFVFASADAEVASGDGTWKSTADYTMAGQNLMQDKGAKAGEWNVGFNGTKDTDIMIADFVSRAKGNTNEVGLIFKHTFAKLLVAVKAQQNAPATASDAGYTIKITKVTAENYKSTGAYNNAWTASGSATVDYEYEALTAALVSGDAKVKTSKIAASADASADAIKLTTTAKNFIESLIMPQGITGTQDILVEYEITTQDGKGNSYSETFKRPIKANEIFSSADATSYDGSNKYVVTITIGPKIITFDAGVSEWGFGASGDYTIE